MAHPYAGQAQSSIKARLKRLGATAGKAHGYSSMYKKKSYPGKNAGSSTPLTISGGSSRKRPDRMASGGGVGKRKGHSTTNIIISHGGAGGAQAPSGPPAVVNRPVPRPVPVPVGGPPVPPRPPVMGGPPPVLPRPPIAAGGPPGLPPGVPPPGGPPMRPPGMKKGGSVKKAAYGGLGIPTKKNGDDDDDDDDTDDYGGGGPDVSDLGGPSSGPPQAGPPANFGQAPPAAPPQEEKKGGSVKKRQGGGGGGIFSPRQGVMVPTKPGRPQNLSGAGRRPPVPNPVPVRTVAGFRAAPPPGLLPGFKKGGKVEYADGGEVSEEDRKKGIDKLKTRMTDPESGPKLQRLGMERAKGIQDLARPRDWGGGAEPPLRKRGGDVHDDEAEDKALMAREFKKRGLASGGIVKTPVTNASGGGAGGKSRKAKSSAAKSEPGQTGSPSPGRTPPPRGMSGSKYHQQGKGLK